MDQNTFPRPRFFLRCDFAAEHSFSDYARAPVTPTRFAHNYRGGIKQLFDWGDYQRHNSSRVHLKEPVCYVYGGIIEAGKKDPVGFLTDGDGWQLVPFDGLFGDLLERVAVVTGTPEGEQLPIIPPSQPEAQPDWRKGNFSVLHFPGTCVAEVWPTTEALAIAHAANDLPK